MPGRRESKMNGIEFLAEKVGKKQLIAIVGMIVLMQMQAESWQVMALGIAGVAAQLVFDITKALFRNTEEPAESETNDQS